MSRVIGCKIIKSTFYYHSLSRCLCLPLHTTSSPLNLHSLYWNDMTNVKRLSSRSSLSINVLGFLGPFDTPTPNGHYYIIYTLPFNRQWHIWSLNYRPCDYVPYVPLLLLTNEGHLVFYQFELFKLQFGASFIQFLRLRLLLLYFICYWTEQGVQ